MRKELCKNIDIKIVPTFRKVNKYFSAKDETQVFTGL